ncbi:UNVERIFIED_ORG: hypothetical protein FHR68_000595 [Xanthomonas campestris]
MTEEQACVARLKTGLFDQSATGSGLCSSVHDRNQKEFCAIIESRRGGTRACPATAGAAAATSNATAAANARSALMPPRDSAPAIGRSSAWQRLFGAWIDAIAGARVHSSAGAAYNMGCSTLISPTDGL